MMPILEPGNIPVIVFLTITLGIPIALVSLVIFFTLEQIPSRHARLFVPSAGALLLIAVTLLFFTGPPSEEQYRQTWALMMMTSFVLNALVILAPFPFFRRFLTTASPSLILCFAVFATVFLLACLGFVGGEIRMPPDAAGYGQERILRVVTSAVAEAAIAVLVYAGLAALGRVVNKEADKRINRST